MKNISSIIIPVKDEPLLTFLIEEIELYLPSTPHEIIIITSDKAKNPLLCIPDNIKIYKSYADSLERSILLGFSVAEGDKIIVMDGDGSHLPQLLPKIIKELNSFEMVVASRFVKTGQYLTSPIRKLITYIFTQYAKLMGSTLSDPMSGYFGIQTQLLQKIKFKPYTWKTALEISNKLRPTTFEIPLTFKNRKVGKSKTNWKIGLKILLDITAGAL